MKNFPPIRGLEFLEEKHWYRMDGNFIPSVSAVIKPISQQVYKDIDKEVMRKAADRGTAVHLAIELYNTTGAEVIEDEYLGYFLAYKKFREDYPKLKLLASEMRVASRALWYAGTIDELYQDEKENYLLVDAKTSYNLEKGILIPQLTGYKNALQECYGIDIKETKVLHLKSDGNYAFEAIETDFNLFLSCISISNFIQNLRFGGNK